MTTGTDIIAAERQRQIDMGFNIGYDDEHTQDELLRAATAYIAAGSKRATTEDVEPMVLNVWPWEREAWHPSPSRIRNLAKAGALIAAEIERLEREL
jgi:hypothetical protein